MVLLTIYNNSKLDKICDSMDTRRSRSVIIERQEINEVRPKTA